VFSVRQAPYINLGIHRHFELALSGNKAPKDYAGLVIPLKERHETSILTTYKLPSSHIDYSVVQCSLAEHGTSSESRLLKMLARR
jgi:hypothetical protein